MGIRYLLSIVLLPALFTGSAQNPDNPFSDSHETKEMHLAVLGQWITFTNSQPSRLHFKYDGTLEVDFGDDRTVNVVSEYKIHRDTIFYYDKAGYKCQDNGKYLIYGNDHYLAFELIEDDCVGRVSLNMGYWVRPHFKASISTLNKSISQSSRPDDYLTRGRIYLTTGKLKKARKDFDVFINKDPNNARAFINRAATQFPKDPEAVLRDCNRAVALEPGNKFGYYQRGLALYESGEKDLACDAFLKAIELGFSILKTAEYWKCYKYWE